MARGAVVHLIALASLIPIRAASGADCNSNGTPDIEEMRSGALPDCNANGVPDGCDILPVNYGLVSAGSFFAGESPAEVVVDDFDGDGNIDVAAASNLGREEITVLWNHGRGHFREPAPWLSGQAALYLDAADLDRDGLKDLAIRGSLGLTVLFQDAERRFSSRTPIVGVEQRVGGLTGGDLDSDSDVDFVVTVLAGVQVIENEGGSFSLLDPMPVGSAPVKVIAANLDGDAALDLATCNITGGHIGNVSILTNRGDGSFDVARHYATARDPGALVVGDMDADGDADLATANQEAITILLNDGQGRFATGTQLQSRNLLSTLESADLDGDGDLDLAAGGGQSDVPAGVSVFLNDGSAGFSGVVGFETGFPGAIESGDVDGDGALELIVCDMEVGAITVLQRAEVAYSTDCNSNQRPDDCELEGNDCNRNALPDECDVLQQYSTDCNQNAVPDECDLPGAGFGFQTTILQLRSFATLLASSDLDSDGCDDIYAVADPGDLLVLWNGGPGGFLPEVRFPAGLVASDGAAGDLDGDGDRDIVVGDAAGIEGLRLFENRGNRTFVEGSKLPSPDPDRISMADLDGDLDLDLVATVLDGTLAVMENQGARAFGDRKLIAEGLTSTMLEVGDLDQDGRPDLAAVSGDQRSLLLFWNEGSLGFGEPTVIVSRTFMGAAASILDADDDGDEDIFLSANQLVLLRNTGPRTFAMADPSPEPIFNVRGVLAGNLDRAGEDDLAILSGFHLAAFLNRGNGVFDGPSTIAFERVETLPVGGDWNGDGAMDLALTIHSSLFLYTNITRPAVSLDTDRNGVPDECQQRPFHRGDSNGDGLVNLTDPVVTLGHLFRGERAPACLEAADTNNDARLEITDPIATLEFLFRGGAPPAAPGPPTEPCGLDTDAQGSAGDLGCGAYEGCGA